VWSPSASPVGVGSTTDGISGGAADGAWSTAAGLYVHEAGAGPLVVLVHGVMDRSNGMLRTRRIIQPDFRVVRYDRRGYGRSQGVEPDSDFTRQVEDLADVLAGRPAVVVGHSFGGIVALALAHRRPNLVRSVVAYEAPMMWADWWESPARDEASEDAAEAAEWFMRRMLGDELWERLPRAMREDRRAEGRAMLADLYCLGPDLPPPYVAEELAVPVVAAHGGQARERHRRATRYLATHAPDAELWVAPGADHGIHLSDPQGFAALVRRGVERADGAPARR
jgi:pimeloyl-ACP methyl ester carboxylesterase